MAMISRLGRILNERGLVAKVLKETNGNGHAPAVILEKPKPQVKQSPIKLKVADACPTCGRGARQKVKKTILSRDEKGLIKEVMEEIM